MELYLGLGNHFLRKGISLRKSFKSNVLQIYDLPLGIKEDSLLGLHHFCLNVFIKTLKISFSFLGKHGIVSRSGVGAGQSMGLLSQTIGPLGHMNLLWCSSGQAR